MIGSNQKKSIFYLKQDNGFNFVRWIDNVFCFCVKDKEDPFVTHIWVYYNQVITILDYKLTTAGDLIVSWRDG